jgi:adenine phosphoribosyltransferase
MSERAGLDLTQFIRNIPDFPKPGILFRDITPLLANPAAFREAIARMASPFRTRGVDNIVAAEARGFIFAAPLALELNCGFTPIRKPGKLPFDTHAFHYELEYGQDTLEMHVDGVFKSQNVLVVDDLFGHRGDRGRLLSPGRKLRRHGGRLRLSDRTGGPEGPGKNRSPRGDGPHSVLKPVPQYFRVAAELATPQQVGETGGA